MLHTFAFLALSKVAVCIIRDIYKAEVNSGLLLNNNSLAAH